MPIRPRCSCKNRVARAMSKLPETVQRQGVNTKKRSTTFVAVLSLCSPKGTYDDLFFDELRHD